MRPFAELAHESLKYYYDYPSGGEAPVVMAGTAGNLQERGAAVAVEGRRAE